MRATANPLTSPDSARWLPSRRAWHKAGLLCLALALGACANTRTIESEVRSFAAPTQRIPLGAAIQIERRPSQDNESFAAVAKSLSAELERQGLKVQDSASAPWVAQIHWQADAVEPPADLRHPSPFGSRMWVGTSGSGMAITFQLPAGEGKWTLLSLSVVLRERATQAVAFDAQAQYQGPWSDADVLADALVRSAFTDYPNGQPRTVTVRREVAR